MLRKMLSYFALPLLLLLSNSSGNSAPHLPEKRADAQTGTLEKMIVAQGSVAMDFDLQRLNGTASAKDSKATTLRFQVDPNSFFTTLVFNDAFRGVEGGSIGLIPENTATLPGPLQTAMNQLVIEKLSSEAPFDLAVRDGKTGFVFFNIEGNLYQYDAAAHSLVIKDGRLLISEEVCEYSWGVPRTRVRWLAGFQSRRPCTRSRSLPSAMVRSNRPSCRLEGMRRFRIWCRDRTSS